MNITPMTVFWILLGVAVVIGFGVLVSRQVKAGKDVGVPTSVKFDTHDMPPEGSDAQILEEQRHEHSRPAEHTLRDVHDTHPKPRM